MNLNDIIDLIWPQEEQLNDCLAANTEVLRMIESSNLTLREREPVHLATGNKQIYDPLFPGYNANGLPNSNYVAAEGPNDIGLNGMPTHGGIARFFENTLFNHAFPIKLILAIGHYGSQETRGDFAYYFGDGAHSYSTFDESSQYAVQSRRVNTIVNEYELRVEHSSGSIQVAQLFWLPVADLQPLPADRNVILALAQVYKLSRSEPVIIHCAAGVGRTGTAILTFKILDHYAAIFGSTDPVYAATQIRKLLVGIRTVRPAFVTTRKQLASAIQCAMEIYNLRTKNAQEN